MFVYCNKYPELLIADAEVSFSRGVAEVTEEQWAKIQGISDMYGFTLGEEEEASAVEDVDTDVSSASAEEVEKETKPSAKTTSSKKGAAK